MACINSSSVFALSFLAMQARNQLLKVFPVIIVLKGACENCVLVDTHSCMSHAVVEGLLHPTALPESEEDFFANISANTDDSDDEMEASVIVPSATSSAETETGDAVTSAATPVSSALPEPRTRGRKPLHEKHPLLVPTVRGFILANGASAQERRRTETAQVGVSIPQIRAHVREKLGIEVSDTVLRRLLIPPHKGRRSARNYKSLINAKVAAKNNSGRHDKTGDAHFAAAQSRVIHELHALHSSETVVVSVDDMNKCKVGPLAVSRYHQIRRFFMDDDAPKCDDHDWPLPGYYIGTSGYLMLTSSCEEGDVKEPLKGKDRHNRPRVITPTSGPLHVYLRGPNKHAGASTVTKHLEDLWDVLEHCDKAQLKAVYIKADGGSDFSPSSVPNLIYYGRLWRALKVAIFSVVVLAPGMSAYGEIEHAWSPLSNALTSVRLESCAPGDHLPPFFQTLTPGERAAKERLVFDAATSRVASIFGGLTFDGHSVSATAIPCRLDPDGGERVIAVPQQCINGPVALSENSNNNSSSSSSRSSKSSSNAAAEGVEAADVGWKAPVTSDYGTVHDFCNASGKAVVNSPAFRALRTELRFLLQHVDRREYALIFVACQSEGCECNGSKEDWTKGILKDVRALGGLPSPLPSTTHEGHFQTLFDHLEAVQQRASLDGQENDAGNLLKPRADWYMPSRSKQDPGFCPECPAYVYTSAADAKHHQAIAHAEARSSFLASGPAQDGGMKIVLACPNAACAKSFSSKWGLKTHIRIYKHKKLKEKQNKPKAPKPKKGRFTNEGDRPSTHEPLQEPDVRAGEASRPKKPRGRPPSKPVAAQSQDKQKKPPVVRRKRRKCDSESAEEQSKSSSSEASSSREDSSSSDTGDGDSESDGDGMDFATLPMVALWSAELKSVLLAGWCGENKKKSQFGQWFNYPKSRRAQSLADRHYAPAWVDRSDDKEKFAYKRPDIDFSPCGALWEKADELVARFQLVDGRIPAAVAAAIEVCQKQRQCR